MEKKVCSKCKEEKEVCEFSKSSNRKDGYQSQCKNCKKEWKLNNREHVLEYNKNYNQKNKEKLNGYKKKWKQSNSKQISNFQKNYKEKNKEKLSKYQKKWKESNSEKVKESQKKWKENNSEKLKKYQKEWYLQNKNILNEKIKLKKLTNPIFLISCSVRKRMSDYIRKNNILKKNKTFEIVGCTPQQLKEYIQSQFRDNMSWENYGYYGWHIDHIIPLSSANTEEELYKLCHFTNLQPLWAEDNLKKSNKLL
jgi:flagellar biosynthesis GTPase FlhF